MTWQVHTKTHIRSQTEGGLQIREFTSLSQRKRSNRGRRTSYHEMSRPRVLDKQLNQFDLNCLSRGREERWIGTTTDDFTFIGEKRGTRRSMVQVTRGTVQESHTSIVSRRNGKLRNTEHKTFRWRPCRYKVVLVKNSSWSPSVLFLTLFQPKFHGNTP